MAKISARSCATCGLSALFVYVAFCALLYLFFFNPPAPNASFLEDKGAEVIADFFSSNSSSSTIEDLAGTDPASRIKNFFFGLATAPAHVEDQLNDAWLEFARGHKDHYPVKAWQNIPVPEERLRFWTQPNVEIELAAETGITVFRLGIDWGRIVRTEPVNGIQGAVDKEAVEHYKQILRNVRQYGLKVMLTLFHHSLPKWAAEYGGWLDRRTVNYFEDFTRYADEQFGEYVDYWITFNEPHIFVLLTYCSGIWPPGLSHNFMESLMCLSPFGSYGSAMNAISLAHKTAYDVLHERNEQNVVGVAHHVGVINPYGLLDIPAVLASRLLTEFQWTDQIENHLDFLGINYYGQEIISAAGLMLDKDEEYSEAGRGVYPNGLYEVLMAFHKRYKSRLRRKLRYIITENGFSDDRDLIRRPYLVEHLLALYAAIQEGVPVDGYIHWTISDNWEWADGYCPKFGLVGVDRSNSLKRYPRPSYYLYQKIAKSGLVTQSDRTKEWGTLREEMQSGGMRPFCRSADAFGRMWAEGLDSPVMRQISSKDWRFSKATKPSFHTYIQRSGEVAKILLSDVLRLLVRTKANDGATQEL